MEHRRYQPRNWCCPLLSRKTTLDLGSPSGQIPELSGGEVRGEQPGAQRAQLRVPPTSSSRLPRHAWSTPCCLIAYKSTSLHFKGQALCTAPGVPFLPGRGGDSAAFCLLFQLRKWMWTRYGHALDFSWGMLYLSHTAGSWRIKLKDHHEAWHPAVDLVVLLLGHFSSVASSACQVQGFEKAGRCKAVTTRRGSAMGGRRLLTEPCRGLVIQMPACHQPRTTGLCWGGTSRRRELPLLVGAHPWHEAVVKSGLHLQCHAMQLGKSCSVGDCCLNRQAHIRIETVSAWAEMLTVPLGCPIGSRLQIKLV
nr:uncharacterized protein LOC106016420 [Anas platyrhynchos]